MVPTLEIDHETKLSEVLVISLFLADKKPELRLAPAADSFERFRQLEMLSFIATEVQAKFIPVLRPFVNEEAKDQFRALLVRNFTSLNQRLADGRDYLFGADFTVADAFLFSIVPWVVRTKVDILNLSHLVAYMDRVAARPSVAKAMKEEGGSAAGWRDRLL